MKSLSCVWLFATPWTAAYQVPLSMGFARQEYWSGLPFPCPMHESEKSKWSSVVSYSLWPHGLQPTRLLGILLSSLLQHHSSKASVLSVLSLLYGPTLTSIQFLIKLSTRYILSLGISAIYFNTPSQSHHNTLSSRHFNIWKADSFSLSLFLFKQYL